MENKVLFIYPPSPVMNREDRCQQPTDDLVVIPPLPPMDLLYMASVARMTGYKPYVRDYSLNSLSMDDLIKDIKEINPRYIVFNAASTTLENDVLFLEHAKKINKDIITVAKGAHFLFKDTEALNKYKYLDIVIRGEVEFAIKDILSGKDLSDIEGIT